MDHEPSAADAERRDLRERVSPGAGDARPKEADSVKSVSSSVAEPPAGQAAYPAETAGDSEKAVGNSPYSARPDAKSDRPSENARNETDADGEPRSEAADEETAANSRNGAYDGGRSQPKTESQRESLRTPFEPLPAETRTRILSTFVDTDGFRILDERLKSKTKDARLICVSGSKNSGRFTSAWRIGYELAGAERRPHRVFQLAYSDRRRHILDVVGECQLESDAVYVVRDLFDSPGAVAQLSSEVVDQLNFQFRRMNVFVVATVLAEDTTTSDQFDRLPIVSGGKINHHRVFRSHLDWYTSDHSPCKLSAEARKSVEARWDDFSDFFSSPVQVASFCLSFARDPDSDPVNLARSICRVDWATMRQWFDGLAIEERLYALMVVLFDQLDPSDLDAVFVSCLQQLRANGLEARDPRLIDFGEMRRHLRIDEQSNRFVSAANEKYVAQRVKGHLALLTSVIEEVIKGLPTLIDRTARRYRETIGAAIGRVAVHDINLLRRTITSLAESPIAEISRAVGYVVHEAAIMRSDVDATVREVLFAWASSRNFDHVWTTAASIPLIADSVVERMGQEEPPRHRQIMDMIEEVIRLIAGNVRNPTDPLSQSVRDTLKNSIAVMSRTHPETVLSWLESWLALDRRNADDPNVVSMWNLAFGAANLIFASVKDPATLTKTHDRKLLDLLPALLIAYDDEWDDDRTLIDLLGNAQQQMQIDRLLEFAARWIDDARWQDPVQDCLLKAISKGGKFVRLRIVVHVLARWMAPSNPVRRSIAMRIVARSRAVDGAVIDLPSGAVGILVTETDKDRSTFGDTVEFVASCLESQARIVRRLLGHRGDSATESFRSSEVERVRLAYPAVEDLRHERGAFVLIVHTVDDLDLATRDSAALDAVHDIEDLRILEGVSWSDRIEPIPVITGGAEIAAPDAFRFVSVSRAAREILDRADRLLSQILDARTPDEWRDLFRSAGYQEIADAAGGLDVLEIAERWLNIPSTSAVGRESRDVVAAISPVVQFSARLDIDATVATLERWMAALTLHSECAVAAARSLVRTSRLRLSRQGAAASRQDAALIKLGPALAKANASEALVEWCRLVELIVADSAADSPAATKELSSCLGGAVENSRGRTREALENNLDAWANERTSGAANSILKSCAEQMRYRIRFSMLRGSARRPEGGNLVAIIVDSADLNLSADLREALKSTTEFTSRAKIKTAVFRLGDSRPIALPEEAVEISKIAADGSLRFVRLVGPIVDRLPKEIERIVYFGSGDIRDKDDLSVAIRRRLIAVGKKNVLAADEFIPTAPGAANVAERIRRSLATNLTKGAAES